MNSPFLNRPIRSIEEARSDMKRDTDALDAWREKSAIAARRRQLETDLRAEGHSEETIARLATNEVAAKMVENERGIVAMIANALGGLK